VAGVLSKGKPNRSLHLTRPSDLFFAAHRLAVVVIGISAGQVSFMFGPEGRRWR
jgi:hypothetical protein